MNSFPFERVLTIGASGMIGSYVDFGLRPTQAELDIRDSDAVMRYVTKQNPSAILLLAGATDMARCEQEPAYAYELNVRGTYNVALAAQTIGAPLVYVSTSRVFKGDKEAPYEETDEPQPLTHYGRTKHIGELIVQAMVPKHIVARTAWVFGGGSARDTKFYGSVITKLQSGAEVAALTDVRGSPTYGKDFIEAVKTLLQRGEYGVVHIANGGVATRYDIARVLNEALDTKREIRAVDRSFFPSGGYLPENESIRSNRVTLRPWEEALHEYLAAEWKTLSH